MVSTSAARYVRRSRYVRRFSVACVLSAGALLCGLAAAPPALAATAHPASGISAAKATPHSSTHFYQTPEQASAQAARTGQAVQVTGATTPTSTLTANPNGSYSLTESGSPVRTKVDGTWRTLNPDLARNPDGTYSPAMSTNPLTLSGGGTGALATMTYGGYKLSLSAPMRLPAPSVSGATATYAGILPGVDLIVTADPGGGYSEDLRIASATAAANPALTSLTFTTRATGLVLKAAKNGTLSARTQSGQVIFAAPPSRMWDSAVSPPLRAMVGKNRTRVDPATGELPRSTVSAPAPGAHIQRLGVSIAGNRMTLTPNHGLLTETSAVFPEYIDPTWDSAGSAASNWAYVSSEFPNQPYYDGSDYLQVGDQPDNNNNSTGWISDSFYQLPVPTKIRGAYIDSATAYFPEVWADSCTASAVDLYQTSAISGSTTYNNQPSWGTKLGSDDVAYGWSSAGTGGPSNCPDDAKDVTYSVKSVITADAATAPGTMPALNVGLKAESSDVDGWKQFANPRTSIAENASLTITYAFQPDKPFLYTSPATDCGGTTVLGNGNVILDAKVNNADGNPMTVTFAAYANGNTSDTFATNPSMSESSGADVAAPFRLSAADLESADAKYGTSGVVSITWTAKSQVGLTGVPASPTATCQFKFSTAKPGAPDITDPTGASCGDTGSTQQYSVGTAVKLTATGNATASAPANPDSYSYQLNGGNPIVVAAGTSSPYKGTITITPTRITNVVTVTAIAAGGNIGQTASCWITASPPPAAVDQDMNGDGIPDLLTVGSGSTGTAAGLWLASGNGNGSGGGSRFDGTIDPTGTDIGPYGPQGLAAATSGANSATPASWTGLRAMSGQFLGPGFNDIEAYHPGTDQAYVLQGEGDGSIAASQDTNFTDVFTDTHYYDAGGDQTSDYPLQLANAYNVSGNDEPYPDQIGLFSDATTGSFLAYFANNDGVNTFDAGTGDGQPYELTNSTPDGSAWSDWTITTDSDTRGGTADTDLYLWNSDTGALYLWELTGLTSLTTGGFDIDTFTDTNPTATLTGSLVELSANWHKGGSLNTLQGTDIGGQPGLMDVTSTGQIESWAWNGTALVQANATGADQRLLTADHTYLLDDSTDDGTAVTTAADQPGAGKTEYDLTGNSGTTWNTGSIFGADVAFNGTSGYLASSSTAGDFTPNTSFTVSAWVKPSALGGTVFSQNGTSYSTVKVYSSTAGQWTVAVSTGGSTYATAAGGTARDDTWSDLTLTYDSANGSDTFKLYDDGVVAATLGTASPGQTGKFLVGADQAAAVAAGFLAGEVATVQVWDSLATPEQPATAPSVFIPITPVRIMDTRSAFKIGSVTGPVGAGAAITVPIDGNTTASLPSNVSAVAIAVTVTAQTDGGDLTLYPDGTPLPGTSNLNYSATGGNTTNDAIVPVGSDGKIAIHNGSNGTAQVIVDLTGYFTTATSATGASTYTPLPDPARILDTRNNTPAGVQQIPAAGTLALTIGGTTTGGADIPATGVTGVALNLTAVAASGDSGFLTVYPDGVTRPLVTLLNYGTGASAGTVIIPVAVGVDGKIDIYNNSTTATNVLGDISGYFTNSTSGQYYHPLDSTRIIDTRQTSPLGANGLTTIGTPSNIPADDPALVINITATLGTTSGDLQAYPSTAATPVASILNYAANENIANLALINTATGNAFTIKNSSSGTVDFIIDVNGYFQ
jgi:hypothetical protein